MWIILLATPIIILLILIEIIYDAVTGQKKIRFGEMTASISSAILARLADIIATPLMLAAYNFLYSNWRIFHLPNTLWTGILLFVLVDICYYWGHRLNHEIAFLWADHSIHHSAEDFNFSTGIRSGVYQVFYGYVFYLPLAIAGFETGAFLSVIALSYVYQLAVHTERIDKLGWLEEILITPSHHRVHHARNPAYIDKNYGAVFVLWDRLFGTFTREQQQPVYGITVPVNGYNLFRVQTHQLRILTAQVKAETSWPNKLKRLFYKPGWRMQQQPATAAAPNRQAKKCAPVLKQYLSVQFVTTFLLAILLILLLPQLNHWQISLGAAVVLINFQAIGVMYEQQAAKQPLESWRLLLSPAVGAAIFLCGASTAATWLLAYFAASTFLSFLHWQYVKKNDAAGIPLKRLYSTQKTHSKKMTHDT